MDKSTVRLLPTSVNTVGQEKPFSDPDSPESRKVNPVPKSFPLKSETSALFTFHLHVVV